MWFYKIIYRIFILNIMPERLLVFIAYSHFDLLNFLELYQTLNDLYFFGILLECASDFFVVFTFDLIV